MLTNRISGYFESLQRERRKMPRPGFIAVPAQLVGCPRPFAAPADLYRLAYESAKAELQNQLLALLRSRWELIHLS